MCGTRTPPPRIVEEKWLGYRAPIEKINCLLSKETSGKKKSLVAKDDDPPLTISTQNLLHRGLVHFPNREHVSHNEMNTRGRMQKRYPTNIPHYPYPS